MSKNHWFVDAFSELIDDARQQNNTSAVAGFNSVLKVFCAEMGLTEEQETQVKKQVFKVPKRAPDSGCSVKPFS